MENTSKRVGLPLCAVMCISLILLLSVIHAPRLLKAAGKIHFGWSVDLVVLVSRLYLHLYIFIGGVTEATTGATTTGRTGRGRKSARRLWS